MTKSALVTKTKAESVQTRCFLSNCDQIIIFEHFCLDSRIDVTKTEQCGSKLADAFRPHEHESI